MHRGTGASRSAVRAGAAQAGNCSFLREGRALLLGTAPAAAAMPEGKAAFREVLPKQGQLSVEDAAAMVLCKPKVLPLKSVSLEKLEELQRAALAAARPPEGTPRPPEGTPPPRP